jgi:hypothetical protein
MSELHECYGSGLICCDGCTVVNSHKRLIISSASRACDFHAQVHVLDLGELIRMDKFQGRVPDEF